MIVATSLPKVPRAWIDYEGVPLLEHVHQPDLWGTDTIADSYEARVVLNDPLDMYTKRGVAQTPIGSRDVDEGTVGAPSSLARSGRAARE